MEKSSGLIAGFSILTAILLVCHGIGFAHPHVFIAQQTRILFDEKGMAGIKVRWTFDEMFSVMILEDFDPDKNKILDEKEVQTIKEKAFSYIAPHNYYVHISIEGKPFRVRFIKDFKAFVKNNNLIYEFLIPCHVTAVDTPKKITISPYDPEYYSAIYFPEGRHLTIENAERFEVAAKTDIDRSTLFYYETVNPYALFLTFKIKS